jgi:hypothetical protein
VPLHPLVDVIYDSNGLSRDPDIPSSVHIGDEHVSWPSPNYVHEALIKGSIQTRDDFCIISPLLKHHYLDHYALTALFKLLFSDQNRKAVLVFTRDPHVRDRFENMGPPHGQKWSKREFPVGSVTHDGRVAVVTRSEQYETGDPRFIVSRCLHHLPEDEAIANNVGCIIYDESVTFKQNRWEQFLEWRERFEVPSTVYCLRDPLGPEYQRINDDVTTWGWSPRLLESVVDPQTDQGHATATDGGNVTERRKTVEAQLQRYVDDCDYEVHTIAEGELAERLTEAWTKIEAVSDIQNKIREPVLAEAISELKTSIEVFSNVIASSRLANQALDDRYGELSLTQCLDRLNYQLQLIRNNDATQPAEGAYNDAIHELDFIYDDWDGFSVSDTKRGHVYRTAIGALDQDKEVIVASPSDGVREAFHLDIQSRDGSMYAALDDGLQVLTPDELADADPTDHLVLYGPPRRKHRWILRNRHAPTVTIVAYKHQLRLLRHQIYSINGELEKITDSPAVKAAESIVADDSTAAPSIATVPAEVPEEDIPSESAVAEGHGLVEERDEQGLKDIIGQASNEFANRSFDGTSSSSSGSSSSKGSSHRSGEVRTHRIVFENGLQIHKRPSDDIHVVDEARNNAETKAITKLSNGDTVIIVQRTDSLRDQLEQAIKQQGDHRLLFHARIWKRKLEQAIEEEEDHLDDFIEKCEEVGLDRRRQTFRKWYNLEISHTRAEDDMKKLADAYDLTVVKENFEQIWAAAIKVDVLHKCLLRELRERAYRAVTESMDEIVLDEEFDIRLSDFDTVDEHGNQLVQVLDVVGVEENVKVPRYRVNQLERISEDE